MIVSDACSRLRRNTLVAGVVEVFGMPRKEETVIEHQRRLARESKKPLDRIDRMNVSSVLQAVGHATVHLAMGELFYAGRYHYIAECTMTVIENAEARGTASDLCDVVREACRSIEKKIVDANRYKSDSDVVLAKLIRLLVCSEAWCDAVDEGVELKLRLRHGELSERLARRGVTTDQLPEKTRRRT